MPEKGSKTWLEGKAWRPPGSKHSSFSWNIRRVNTWEGKAFGRVFCMRLTTNSTPNVSWPLRNRLVRSSSDSYPTSFNLFARQCRVCGQCLFPFQTWGAYRFHTWQWSTCQCSPQDSCERICGVVSYLTTTSCVPVQLGARTPRPTAHRPWRPFSGSLSQKQTAPRRFSDPSASSARIARVLHLVRR